MKPIFLSVMIFTLFLFACKKEEIDTSPQIADVNSVGCLIANDFYAVHFSAYLKPANANQAQDRKALLTPYCQELPDIGQVFFAADLIDRDIRQTPIAIRIAQIEITGKQANDIKEIRLTDEIPAKIYSKGVIEAQANIDKKGEYALILLIGGDDVISQEDKLKVILHVGTTSAQQKSIQLAITASVLFLLLIAVGVVVYLAKSKRQRI